MVVQYLHNPQPHATVTTPLLSSSSSSLKDDVSKRLHADTVIIYNENKTNNHNEGELYFYNPWTILDISRDVASAYLILLTGGAAVEYVAPAVTTINNDYADGRMSSSQESQLPLQNASIISTTTTTTHHPPSTTSTKPDRKVESVNKNVSHRVNSQSMMTTTNLLIDESVSSLAYAAIVDGNVLNACFGVKMTPNGRITHNNNIKTTPASDNGGGTGGVTTRSYSIFCCLPHRNNNYDSSSPTLDTLVLSHNTTTLNNHRARMQYLVDILREIRDIHYEMSADNNNNIINNNNSTNALIIKSSSSKEALYWQVIHTYVHCFTSIVRYHDAKDNIELVSQEEEDHEVHDSGEEQPKNRHKVEEHITNNSIICFQFLDKIRKRLLRGRIQKILSRKTNKMAQNLKLEELRKNTLLEIDDRFQRLKVDVLEHMASETTTTSTVTGCASSSLEESLST